MPSRAKGGRYVQLQRGGATSISETSTPAVVVTRSEDPRAGRLGRALRRGGAPVLHWPVTEIVAPADPEPLDEAARSLNVYDWLVLTSRRGVAALAELVDALPPGLSLATVGAKTAGAARGAGWTPDLVTDDTSRELAEALLKRCGEEPARFLLPTTPMAADTLPDLLEAAGHRVDRVEAYRTVFRELDVESCARRIRGGDVGAVTFTSPSAVEGLARALPDPLLRELRDRAGAASMGPTTSAALDEVGWPCRESGERSLEGVARAALELLERAGPHSNPKTESEENQTGE